MRHIKLMITLLIFLVFGSGLLCSCSSEEDDESPTVSEYVVEIQEDEDVQIE